MFKREKLFEKYKELYEEYYKKKKNIEAGNKKICELEQKKEQIKASLNEKRMLCQQRLDQLTEKEEGTSPHKGYNEESLRKKKEREEAKELEELDSFYDKAIADLEFEIAENKERMQQELETQVKIIENDPVVAENYQSFQEIVNRELLPNSIKNYFSNTSKEAVIEEACIQNVNTVRTYASHAVPFHDIRNYAPDWLEKVVNFGIPAFVSLLGFFVFFLGVFELSFIRGASNALASFLLWSLIAAIAGGIFYLIGQMTKGIGKITGIIGAILGFFIALQWDVELPYFVTDIIQLIFKIIIIAVIGMVSYFIITRTALSPNISGILVERIPVLRKIAMNRVEENLATGAVKYYVLAYYRDILSVIIDREFEKENNRLFQKWQELQQEKEEKKHLVSSNANKKLEQELKRHKSQWEMEHEKCLNEMELCRKNLENYDRKLLEEEAKYENSIKKIKDDSQNAEEAQKQYRLEMKEILKELDESKFPELTEIPGIIAPSVYILPEWKNGEPKMIQQLCHNEKPVLLVYHTKKEDTDEKALLYQAMQKLIVEFLGNNPWDALKIGVVDTVNSASDLGKAAREELLDIYDTKNISRLYEDVERYTKKNSQNNKWKEEIKERARRSGQMSKEFAYRLVFFLIPPNRTSNWFDDRLWNIIGSGLNYGFLPVFVVPEREYMKEKKESVYGDIDKVVKDQKYDLEMEDGKEDIKINVKRRG